MPTISVVANEAYISLGKKMFVSRKNQKKKKRELLFQFQENGEEERPVAVEVTGIEGAIKGHNKLTNICHKEFAMSVPIFFVVEIEKCPQR
jgi:hypothetical protein